LEQNDLTVAEPELKNGVSKHSILLKYLPTSTQHPSMAYV